MKLVSKICYVVCLCHRDNKRMSSVFLKKLKTELHNILLSVCTYYYHKNK